MEPIKVLIAEDDISSAKLLQAIFSKYNFNVTHVSNGEEAVEYCRTNPDLQLVMMDVKLTEMSGLMATQQIREFNKDIVVIAQTAFALREDREKALAAGCTDYITKPIRRDDLVKLLEKYFN